MPIARYFLISQAAEPVVFAAPNSPKIATDSTALRSVKWSSRDHEKIGQSRFHGSRPWSMEPSDGSRGPIPLLPKYLPRSFIVHPPGEAISPAAAPGCPHAQPGTVSDRR